MRKFNLLNSFFQNLIFKNYVNTEVLTFDFLKFNLEDLNLILSTLNFLKFNFLARKSTNLFVALEWGYA